MAWHSIIGYSKNSRATPDQNSGAPILRHSVSVRQCRLCGALAGHHINLQCLKLCKCSVSPGLEGSCGWLHPQARAPPIPLTAPATHRSAAGSLPQATAAAVSFGGTQQARGPQAHVRQIIGVVETPLPCCRHGRVGEDVASLTPHSAGRADFPHPVLHGRASLTAV